MYKTIIKRFSFLIFLFFTIIIICGSSVLYDEDNTYVNATVDGITRQQICRTILLSLSDTIDISKFDTKSSPFTDTDDKFVIEANQLGFIKGDGSCEFHPDNFITKQDAAVLFQRVQEYLYPNLVYDNAKIKQIKDIEEIEPYAKNAVLKLSMTDVIVENQFYPTHSLTEAETRLMLSRIFANKNKVMAKPGVLPKKRTPTLMYHEIRKLTNSKSPFPYLFVSPEAFEEQIKYLSDHHYTFLFPDELDYADSAKKSVVITFDDGYASNYSEAFRILKKYNAKGTIFVIGSAIGKPDYLTKEQIKEMAQSGYIQIGSHSMSHIDLSTLNEKTLHYELDESKKVIEQITGRTINSVSYPYGNYSNALIKAVPPDYQIGFSVQQGTYDNPLFIRRVVISPDVTMKNFTEILAMFP